MHINLETVVFFVHYTFAQRCMRFEEELFLDEVVQRTLNQTEHPSNRYLPEAVTYIEFIFTYITGHMQSMPSFTYIE